MNDITELAQSLKAAAEKATPGQWMAFTHADSQTFSVHTPDDKRCGDVIKWAGFDGQRKAKANAEFIALANPSNILALVEALEKAQQRIDELENDEVRQRLANAEHQLYMAELAKHNLKASRKAQFRKRRAAEKRIGELEREQEQLRPVGVMSEQAFHRLENRECRFIALWPRPGIFLQRKRPEDGVIVYARTAAAAGIKVEAE
ncbi:Ead domain protein [Klebsiella pneumoniae]|uniref:ead/Ea22-like family protein n=1 Tax=Klebsiella pneumoniae TaxID=573 RepID=UPI000E2A766A|nr:ead/Ea22-like family protein [Klebsiella pneumoniae]SXX06932.1 Ead domain protein [Klebsiella pneumoniae]